MRWLGVLVAWWLTGCSAVIPHVPEHSTGGPRVDCTVHPVPVALDAVGGLGFGVLGISAVSQLGSPGMGAIAAGEIGLPSLVLSAFYIWSARAGSAANSRCENALREQRQEEPTRPSPPPAEVVRDDGARSELQLAARRDVLRMAWDSTRKAAKAAQDGDCAQVRVIAAHVQLLDPEFYKSVFTREPTIASCTVVGP